MCEFIFNPFRKDKPEWPVGMYDEFASEDISLFHKSLDSYKPSPLVSLPALAAHLGVAEIHIKDEADRFGIKAYKALGASYSIFKFLKNKWEEKFNTEFKPEFFKDKEKMDLLGKYTFCAATDGNHGKAVAWTAKMLGQNAVIYMPGDAVQARITNIEVEGAKVVVLKDGTYDDCVVQVNKDAQTNEGWAVISDTAYEGYTEIPKYIMAGYTAVFKELEDSINIEGTPKVDFVFTQTGVGGLTGAAMWYYYNRYGANRPKFISVEPIEADCFVESARYGNGEPLATKGNMRTIMAGLSCGVPSLVSWPIIRDLADLFLSVSDYYAEVAMRRFYYPLNNDSQIISCEAGAGGFAGLLALLTNNKLAEAREKLGLNKNSRILIVNTEGETDPINFKRIIDMGPVA